MVGESEDRELPASIAFWRVLGDGRRMGGVASREHPHIVPIDEIGARASLDVGAIEEGMEAGTSIRCRRTG